MGGWKLEVGRMALYMGFPVSMFYLFNQPQYFEEWVVKMRRELYPPVDQDQKKQLDDCIKSIRDRKEKENLEMLKKENK